MDASSARPTLVITDTRVDGVRSDIRVAGDRIAEIEPHDPERPVPGDARRIDGSGTAALPGLMNGHTHAAMALLRSYADDLPLMTWLQEKIWPFEARLTEEDVYWGTRLGCLEMIRTGTTFFNDMYWHFDGIARAAVDAGMRAVVSGVFIDMGDADRAEQQREQALACLERAADYPDRIGFAFGPHAIYTVSGDSLRWVAERAAEHDAPVHIHLAETGAEVDDCLRAHSVRPVGYLDAVGLLGPRTVAAHAVHLTDEEIGLLAERGVHVVHNPVSNLKLASGGPMRYRALKNAGVNVLIGTDGSASNNNLDLLEELKFAALAAKHATGDPTALPADEALALATTNAARAFGVEAGELEPGALADIVLVDLESPYMFPGHDLAADLVYSAHGRAVTTTICDGRVLMEEGVVPDEAEIRREVRSRWRRLAAD